MSMCIICNSKKSRVVRDTVRYGIKRKVLQCRRCSLVYLEPLARVSLAYYASKKYRATHGPHLKKSSSPREIFNIYSPYQEKIIREIEPLLRPETKILDVGCSTGHFLAALKGKVKERVGLELGKAETGFIKKNLDFKVYQKTIEEANIEEGPFDVITVIETLEHITDPLRFLSGITKNLKPNGHVYIEVPNISDVLLSVYHIKGYADFYYREPHVFYFSEDTLQALMEKAGFSGHIKTIQRYNFLNHLHWLFTERPQDDFALAAGNPKLVSTHGAGNKIASALNKFIQKTDVTYKELLGRHHAGDLVTFLGRKKD